MTWWNVLPEMAAALALVFAPGLILAYCIGVRGLGLVGLAPLLTVAIFGVAGIAAGFTGIPWNLLPVTLTTLGASVVAWTLSRFLWKTSAAPVEKVSFHVVAGAALGIAFGAFFVGRRMLQVIGSPENFAQRFDNVFHLNAIQYINQTGNASSLTLGNMVGAEGGSALYPSAWHSIAALIAQVSGSSVVISENVLNIVIAAIIWPTALMFLVRTIVGWRPIALALAGAFSAGYAAFPISIMDFGPLYPNILAYAILPAATAVLVQLCNLGATHGTNRSTLWMILVVAIPGLALSQTNGLLALVAFALPMGLAAAWTQWLRVRSAGANGLKFYKLAAGTGVGLLAFVVFWKLLRPLAEYDGWAPFTTQAGAVGEAVVNGAIGRPPAWVVSILALIGIHRVLRNYAKPWIFFCWLMPVVLYVTTASTPKGFWRSLLTGGWYQDSYRLAALLPIFSVVLAVIGSLFLWDAIRPRLKPGANRLAESIRAKYPTAVLGTCAGLFVLALAAASQYGTMGLITKEASAAYIMDSTAPIVDSDELAVINRLSRTVPAGDVIAVNPWNGGALAYALSGRNVTNYHMFTADDPDRKKIEKEIGLAHPDSDVCEIVKERRVKYILDFGNKYLANSAAANDYPGLVDVKDSASVELVDVQGDARLLRVVSCG
ncbi:DUF6541 family protein [[Micrococcus luteus] ATCC 49442]|uniref:DUF6541 family protein n=1 Tax=[Micrococcus luteus] ATCC 49442 TaxID=2698727 RepID=UPI0013DB9304|nr:DUF6541 family protein [[Micrococcus luteus] ATCC 49442]